MAWLVNSFEKHGFQCYVLSYDQRKDDPNQKVAGNGLERSNLLLSCINALSFNVYGELNKK